MTTPQINGQRLLNSLLDLSSKSLVETQRLKPFLVTLQRLKRMQSTNLRAMDTLNEHLKVAGISHEAEQALVDARQMLAESQHLLSEQTVVPTAGQWVVLLLMGIGPVGAAFWLWDHGTKHGDIALLGSLSYLAPLLSTLLLVASGRAEAHWIQAVAVALLLAGAWLSVRASRASR